MRHTGIETVVETYLKNRNDFYRVLLPRIPHPALRNLLSKAVSASVASSDWLEVLPHLREITAASDLSTALTLSDLVKKEGFGSVFGRLAISFEDALKRIEEVEETGRLLFGVLAKESPRESKVLGALAERSLAVLGEILRLGDDVRYHRIALSEASQ